MHISLVAWEIAFYALKIVIIVPLLPYLALLGVGLGMGLDTGWHGLTIIYALILTYVLGPLVLLVAFPVSIVIKIKKVYQYWIVGLVVIAGLIVLRSLLT